MASTITFDDKVDLSTTAVADINKVKASDLNQIKSVINANATLLDEAIASAPIYDTNDRYVKIGNVGICWGRAHPLYANANVLQTSVTLPLSFGDGKCVASTCNYNNQAVELDAIAKVPNTVSGTTLNLALHSKSGAFTTDSTSFYINYVVIGNVNA